MFLFECFYLKENLFFLIKGLAKLDNDSLRVLALFLFAANFVSVLMLVMMFLDISLINDFT